MAKEYREYEVVEQLNRKSDLQVANRQIKEVVGKEAKGDVGIKARGKIDFLTQYCDYSYVRVDSFR